VMLLAALVLALYVLSSSMPSRDTQRKPKETYA
jgi:hypothetical protein